MSIRTIAPALVALALCLAGGPPTRAGTLNIVVQSTTASPGTTGGFDVDLVNNSASAVTIAAFNVDVLLTDTTFVTFTGIHNGTTAPYIFSITGSFPPGFTSNLLPMEAAGNDLSAGGQVVNPGETWGLAHISFLVDSAAPLGTIVPMTLEEFALFLPTGGTSLLDPAGAPIPFSGLGPNGTITIGTQSVPEPTSLVMAGVAALAGVGAWARRRGG
jgi:PEP-CTERM motif